MLLLLFGVDSRWVRSFSSRRHFALELMRRIVKKAFLKMNFQEIYFYLPKILSFWNKSAVQKETLKSFTDFYLLPSIREPNLNPRLR